jgi:hypothetical protein
MNYTDFVGFYKKNNDLSSLVQPEYLQVRFDCGTDKDFKVNFIYYNLRKEVIEFAKAKISDDKIISKFKRPEHSKSEGTINSTENTMTVTNSGYGSKFGLIDLEYISIHTYVCNDINKFYSNHYYFNNGQELVGNYQMITNF